MNQPTAGTVRALSTLIDEALAALAVSCCPPPSGVAGAQASVLSSTRRALIERGPLSIDLVESCLALARAIVAAGPRVCGLCSTSGGRS